MKPYAARLADGTARPCSTLKEAQRLASNIDVGVLLAWPIARPERFEFDGETYTFESMVLANAHDPDVVGWLIEAPVGAEFNGCRRIA